MKRLVTWVIVLAACSGCGAKPRFEQPPLTCELTRAALEYCDDAEQELESSATIDPLDVDEVEIQKTPRADARTELLAITIRESLLADDATYCRLVRDIATIETRNPQLACVRYNPGHDGKVLIVDASTEVVHSMLSGTYTAWNTANAKLELEEMFAFETVSSVSLHFQGLYNTPLLAVHYRGYPGVQAVYENALMGLENYHYPHMCVRELSSGHLEYTYDASEYEISSSGCVPSCSHSIFRFILANGVVVEESHWLGSPADAGFDEWHRSQDCF